MPTRVRGVLSCVAAAAAMAVLTPGCVKERISDRPGATPVAVTQGPQPPPAGDQTPFIDVDDCAGRLQDIEGEILEYYRLHQQLPPSLGNLRPIAQSFGDSGNYFCPVSHQPYVYAPAGLVTQGDDRRLILFDSVPAHGGSRWGILFAEAHGNHPAAAWVQKIPEPMMRRYVPARPPQPASTTRPAARGK